MHKLIAILFLLAGLIASAQRRTTVYHVSGDHYFMVKNKKVFSIYGKDTVKIGAVRKKCWCGMHPEGQLPKSSAVMRIKLTTSK